MIFQYPSANFPTLSCVGAVGGTLSIHGMAGCMAGVGVVVLLKYVIQPLRIVHKVLHAVVAFARQAVCTGEVYLPFHLVHSPVAFAGVEEVDAQSGNNLPAVALFLPVEGERIETVAAEGTS